VVVLLEPPLSVEVDGLRRALGAPALHHIAPHITLVPPVNVRRERLPEVLADLRAAAAKLDGPIGLSVGPPASFLPQNPVLYLAVDGDGAALAALGAARDHLMAGAAGRPEAWPWVPHVTLIDRGTPDDLGAAERLLDRYSAGLEVDRLVLLEERRAGEVRVWAPIADAALGEPAVLSQGVLALELARSTILDPLARSALGVTGPEAGSPARAAIVITARREGATVGAARAYLDDSGGHVAVLVEDQVRRQGIGSHLLAHLESAVRDAGWGCPVLHAEGPPGFYGARSSWSRP